VKKVFGINLVEMVLFLLLGAGYVGAQFWWTITATHDPASIIPAFAGQNPVGVNNMVLLLLILAVSLAYGVVGQVIGMKESPRPIAGFLMRTGVAMMIYSSAGQIIAVFIPAAHWTLPAEGIPVMRTLTIAVSLGIFLAGIGGNMAWGNGRREAFFAATGGQKRK
jgi:hypothetical protein